MGYKTPPAIPPRTTIYLFWWWITNNASHRVKTRLQVQTLEHHDLVSGDTAQSHHHLTTWQTIKAIASTDGPSGLYFGVWGSLVGVASTNFAYFYWYSVVRELYLGVRQNVSAPTTAEELSLSASAGALAQIFTIPVSVITTRQQTQRKGEQKSFWTTGKEVIEAENGWTGLWKGLNASLVLVVNPAITYGAYQRFRAMLFPDRNSLRPLEAFCEYIICTLCFGSLLCSVLGGLSKALATILTQPLIVAKVGLQSEPPPSRKGRPFTSFPEVMRYIVKEEGVSRLYKGIAPQLMKGLLVQGLLMMIKERSVYLQCHYSSS